MTETEEQRVERWARAMCVDAGVDPDGRYSPDSAPWWVPYSDRARQAIALADREAAERVPANPVAWRIRTVNGLGWEYLTEHNQGVQIGHQWEPLYSAAPRPPAVGTEP